MRHRVVIVGSSVGGVRTARALRTEGFTGRITLVGEEPELPYDRPPLSKQVLTGAWPAERAGLLTTQAAADAGIELRLGVAARSLDPEARRVHLADGEVLPYDDLVIATGASARPSPWQPESGLYTLRTLADCRTLKKCFADGASVVMIGGGFIGAEAAAAARSAGCDVTLVDAVTVPMERAAGPVVGALLADIQRRNGARTRFGVAVQSVTGRAGDLAVTLSDTSVVRAEAVVVGIGAIPNDQWLQGSGLTVEDGVVCDGYLAAAGAAHVFAIGDVARWPDRHTGERVRIEHWVVAERQGQTAARNILGRREVFDGVPFFWSQHYDIPINYVGHAERWDEVRVDGSPDAHDCTVSYLRADRRLAVATIYRDRDSLQAELEMERS